jgi:hypothetical protein
MFEPSLDIIGVSWMICLLTRLAAAFIHASSYLPRGKTGVARSAFAGGLCGRHDE